MKRLLLLVPALSAMAFAQSGIPLAANNSIHGLAGTASAITYTLFGVTTVGSNASPQVLAQGVLGTGNASLYVVPNGTSALVTQFTLANTTGSAVAGVTLAINGTAATASFQILPGITIPANGMATLHGGTWTVHDVNGMALAGAVTKPTCLSNVAASAAIVNAEAQVIGCTMPANLMAAGTSFRITFAGSVTTLTSPGNTVFKVRIGTTTLTGNIAATVTAPAVASITAQPFYGEILVTVRTAGASGTVVGQGRVASTHVTTGAFTSLNIVGITLTAVAVDTTAAKIVELSAITGATDSSVLIQNAAIEIIKQ